MEDLRHFINTESCKLSNNSSLHVEEESEVVPLPETKHRQMLEKEAAAILASAPRHHTTTAALQEMPSSVLPVVEFESGMTWILKPARREIFGLDGVL